MKYVALLFLIWTSNAWSDDFQCVRTIASVTRSRRYFGEMDQIDEDPRFLVSSDLPPALLALLAIGDEEYAHQIGKWIDNWCEIVYTETVTRPKLEICYLILKDEPRPAS